MAGEMDCGSAGTQPHEGDVKKGSATVLNNVNDRFEKRFSNSIFVQCVDRAVGFFEAWVSVFDGVLNWNC